MTNQRCRPAPARSQAGVMLLEALVAVLIFSLGVIALMGLQATSITTLSQSKYRTDASYLANQIVGKMWVDQANLASYGTSGYAGRSAWDTQVSRSLPNGAGNIAINGRQVTVIVRWRMPDDPLAHNFTTVATISPAQ